MKVVGGNWGATSQNSALGKGKELGKEDKVGKGIKEAKAAKEGKGKKASLEQRAQLNLQKQYAKIYGRFGLNGEQIRELWQQTKELLLGQAKGAAELDLDQATSLTDEQYKQLVDPEIVANRILDFAKSLAGGDPSKIDLLEGAVMKGFKEAERILGELPDVSNQTFQLVKEGFAQWREEANK